MKLKNFKLLLPVILLFIGLTACASLSKSHTTKYAEQQQMVAQGRIDEMVGKLETNAKKGGRDGVLYGLEAGYWYMFLKDYNKANELFNVTETQISDYEERAKISARDIAANTKAAIASDMELPYKGEMFEKIMMNTLLAMNYLFQGDVEGANIEINKSDLRQQESEEKHQRELKKVDEEKEKQKVDQKTFDSIFSGYQVLDEYASKVVNSFQNSFSYFLGGIVYELNKKIDDAYINYFKSFNLYKNRYSLEKLIELSYYNGMNQQYEEWKNLYKELFNETPKITETGNSKDAELFVIYFSGNVPKKNEAKLAIWFSNSSFNAAFPFYDKNTFYQDNEALEISQDGNILGKTELVLDFIPIVVKSLKEKLPGMIIRQVIRLIAKNKIESTASNKLGFLGQLSAKILNTATERADLRGWYELPENIQVFRKKIHPGTSTIGLKEISGNSEFSLNDIEVTIPEAGTAVVLVQNLSTEKGIHSVVFPM